MVDSKRRHTKHKAGYRHWRGAKPKEFKAKSHAMTEDMRETIALRVSAVTGWSISWLLGIDDRGLKRIAGKYL